MDNSEFLGIQCHRISLHTQIHLKKLFKFFVLHSVKIRRSVASQCSNFFIFLIHCKVDL